MGPGHEVITVAHTFIATAEAISAVGATPVFVDIDPRTYTMDPAALAAAITPATRAIIPVHIYGQPADMDALRQVAPHPRSRRDRRRGPGPRRHLERHARRRTRAMPPASASTPAKTSAPTATPARSRPRTTRRGRTASACCSNHGRHSKYLHDVKGFGERLDTLQAAILRAKLAHLDGWTAARRQLAARYSALLADCELELPFVAPQANPAWHLYVIRTPRRDALLAHLKQHGIEAGVHYPVPLHLQPAYADLGYRRGALPVTEQVADTCLSLPLFPEMNRAEQDRVVAAIQEFLAA